MLLNYKYLSPHALSEQICKFVHQPVLPPVRTPVKNTLKMSLSWINVAVRKQFTAKKTIFFAICAITGFT